jgi:hypothetical protein
VRLGLFKLGIGRFGLRRDALHRLVLRGDLGLGLGKRDAIVAVIEPEQHVARLDVLVLLDRHGGDIACQFGRDIGDVGLDIGVVGADHEAAVDPIVVAVIAAGGERHQADDRQHEAARGALFLGRLRLTIPGLRRRFRLRLGLRLGPRLGLGLRLGCRARLGWRFDHAQPLALARRGLESVCLGFLGNAAGHVSPGY